MISICELRFWWDGYVGHHVANPRPGISFPESGKPQVTWGELQGKDVDSGRTPALLLSVCKGFVYLTSLTLLNLVFSLVKWG